MSKNIYFNVKSMLRRNAVINIVCGGRGIGKSYSAKTYIVDNWIKRGWQGMYVRRYRDDLAAFKSFFADIGDRYPEWEFKVDGTVAKGRLLGDDEWDVVCYSTALSVAHKIKSSSFPRIHTILFDEFIAPINSRYLTDEVTALFELYSTVDRYQDRVRIIMLANAVSIDNPYFNAWGFDGESEWQKYGGNFVLAHFPESAEYMNVAEQSRFGKFVNNFATNYAEYAMGNQFADKSYAYIEPIPKSAKPVMAIRSVDSEVTLYASDGRYWCRTGLAGDTRYALGVAPCEGEVPMAKGSQILQIFKRKWYNGNMLFESLAARNAFRRLL